MTRATVHEGHEEEGWGVPDSPETPGGCFAHFSDIEMPGFRTLSPGRTVRLDWENPGFEQDGYAFRARRVVP
ncbi:cold shock domain-containing protein [Embleya sp. NBC_00896]|uniref:cold shock domain-containing protein n=1 Tax=Embleya sp. NBC_00896 TaxID=2975961 RepID=UPI00386EE9A0|nr:cold shock domain-containing protein [Embleya sp. NBC_00896]